MNITTESHAVTTTPFATHAKTGLRTAKMCRCLLSIFAMLLSTSAPAEEFELVSGDAHLRIQTVLAGETYSLRFLHGDWSMESFAAGKPISITIDGEAHGGYYSDVAWQGNALSCRGTITSEHGTQFVFHDLYRTDRPGSFVISRDVQVHQAHDQDRAFRTAFGLRVSTHSRIEQFEFFVPAIWYRTNFESEMSGELAAHADDHFFFFREDRLPLPLVATREKSSGRTVSLIHLEADPVTIHQEVGRQNVVDERMQFGSIGVRQLDGTSLAFLFPGSEGERNHVVPGSRNIGSRNIGSRNTGSRDTGSRDSWAVRSHPVKSEVRHRYKLMIRFAETPNYARLVQESWKPAFAAYDPILRPVDVQAVYEGLIETLDHYWVGKETSSRYDAPGFPFSVYLPDGNVRLYNYQMGFIGRQLPNAYYLLRHALARDLTALRDKGEQVLDFWAAHSLTVTGLPRTWYDPGTGGAVGTWRPGDNPRGGTALRVATTGMEGMLSAWQLMKETGIDKPAWLDACRRFGDWLVANQNDDGSYFLAYDHQADSQGVNQPLSDSKFAAINPIRFLLKLSAATSDPRYAGAAMRAGEFCFDTIHEDYSYIGSVIDNPNVIDRETGQEAMSAFLALYDSTSEPRWLEAAEQAARYTETWMYAYEVPAEIGRELCHFPADRSIVGQTVIATGHSGADLGLAFSAFDYYRLYIFTGDEHFLTIARLLVHNTKQSLNWDGSLYPGKPKGLQLEAFTVTLPRRMGVMECLSWNYAAHLDPLVRLEETFGSMDIDEIESMPVAQRRELNRKHQPSSSLPTLPP